jgi:hypothetical protein
VASVFQPLFCSQFRFQWSTTRILSAPDALPSYIPNR